MAFFVLSITSCFNTQRSQNLPIVDYVKARTYDGNGVVVMVLRTWDNALSEEEITGIETSLNIKPLTGNVNEVTVPVTEETRVIAYCCASYNDEIPKRFSVVAYASDKEHEKAYTLAENWFIEELAGVTHTYK
jgi:hypothetical protein